MFIQVNSTKGKMCVNAGEVLFIAETRKGTSTLFLTDGTIIDLETPFSEIVKDFSHTNEPPLFVAQTDKQ